MSSRSIGGEKLPAASWRVLALLAISVFINFVDRGNLSIAAPLIKDELHLTAAQLGVLFSAFFWTYNFCQLPVGWLIDRFDVAWILAIGFFLWSAATTVTGFLHGFGGLLMVRLILGIGESVAYPACGKILARHFPEHRRGIANAVIATGQSSGPALDS
jgi:ACS family D-galactonate transporter-like MFS transporter